MFYNADDDDQDFMGHESGRSKLANLFGMDKATNQGGNESLTYTAPKQPKKIDSSSDGVATPAVVVATVVHAYKLVDGQYTSQGKLGATILANHATKDYRILLYVSKQKQVTNAKITPSFIYKTQPNNYASFYDEARMNWSVMFDKEETALKFAKEVALAKANSAGPGFDSVVTQDLVLGEGGSLEVGDSAEIQYTGWLMTNGTFGQIFDSNASSEKLFRFKLGKGRVIKGWDSGILGMKKGGKRLLVVPAHLGYGGQGMGDKIPANSTLIFDVYVVRVKLQKGDSPSDSSAPVQISSETFDSASDTESVKGRSRSISEQLSQSPASDKAKLISRMAKMGKPMLPMTGAVPAQMEDDDLGEPQPTSPETAYNADPNPKPTLARKPEVHQATPQVFQQAVGQPIQQPMAQMMTQPAPQYQAMPPQPAFLQNLPGAQQLSVYQPTNLLQQQQQAAMLQQQNMAGFQQAGFQQPGMVPGQQYTGMSFPGSTGMPPTTPASQPSSVDALAPVLLTETRQQNTEVRLSVSKMSDKVDKILEKVEYMSVHGPGSALAQTSLAPTMETGVLLQNITRIVQENETLKKDVFEKSGKIEAQNDKIAELLQKNQRFAEQSNTLLEERNEGYKYSADQSQAKVLSLEQEKVKLATDLSTTSADLSTLQLEITNIRKSESELRHRLQTAEDQNLRKEEEYNRIKLQALDDEKKMTALVASVREEKQQRKALESQLNQNQEELGDLKTSNESLERNLSERKRKATAERRKLEEDMEDMKINLESEIQSLRDRLRKQKTSVDVATADKVAKLEEDIADEWQLKCNKLLKAAEEKHGRIVRDVEEERDAFQQKIKELESKIQNLRSTSGTSDQVISQLQDKVDDLSVWKDKYENLRNQATAMKERYEERIGDLEEERDGIMEKGRQLQIQNQQLQQALTQAQSQAQTQAQVTPGGQDAAASQDVATEVKKIMNNVYRSLREEFDSDESYLGAEILTVILNAIKTTTLSLVKPDAARTAQDEEEEVESEEEETEQDEEESEEEEQKLEEKQKEDKRKEVSESIVKTDTPVTHTAPVMSEITETMTTTDSHVVQSPPFNATVEPMISCASASATGGEGNQSYSKTLDDLYQPVEPFIDSSSTFVTGDHGSNCYSNKLDEFGRSPAIEPMVASSLSSPLGGKRDIHHSKKLDEMKTSPPIEPTIASSTASMTGDRGNIHHSKKLDEMKTSPPIEPTIASSTASMTGDRGNIHHSKKLDEMKTSPHIEPTIASSTSSMTGDQGNVYHSKKLDEIKTSPHIEPTIASSTSSMTGDQGNVYHSKKLDEMKTSPLIEPTIASSTSSMTGDQGNVYHSKKLDEMKTSPHIEPTIASSTSSMTGDQGNVYHSKKLDKMKTSPHIEPTIASSTSSMTGDQGNVYHSKKLDKMKTSPHIEPTIASSTSSMTGDQGNIYHSKKLDKMKTSPHIEPTIASSTASMTGDQGNLYHSKKLDKMKTSPHIEPTIASSTSSMTGDQGNVYHSKKLDEMKRSPLIEPTIASSTASMTGDQGNVYHSKKLNEMKRSPLIEPTIASSTASMTGDQGNVYHSKKLDKMKTSPHIEPTIASSTSSMTGDQGNVYHSKKLDKMKTSPHIEPTIASSTSSMTGDQGNVYHSKKLDEMKTSPHIEPTIASSTASMTGDQGNILYTHNLDEIEKPVEIMMEDSTLSVNGNHGNTAFSNVLDQRKKAAAVKETIQVTSLQMLGVTGNPGYAEQCDKLTSDIEVPVSKRVVEEVFSKSKEEITGAGGNPYYSRNLDSADFGTVIDTQHEKEPTVTESTESSETTASHTESDEMTGSPKESDETTVSHTESGEVTVSHTESNEMTVSPKESDEKNVSPTESEDMSISSTESDEHTSLTEDSVIPTELKKEPDPTEPEPTQSGEKISVTDSFDDMMQTADTEVIHSGMIDIVKNDDGQITKTESDLNIATDSLVEQNTVSATQDVEHSAADESSDKTDPDSTDAMHKDDGVKSIQSGESHIDPLGGLTNGNVASSSLPTSKDRSGSNTSKDRSGSNTSKDRSSSNASSGKDRSGSKSSQSSSVKSEGLPTLASREPPPLFGDDDDDDDDGLLFGMGNTVGDTLGTNFSSQQDGDKVQKKLDKKDDKKSSSLPNKAYMIDDDSKPTPPPPLFGDDDDDEDLDWLS